MEKALADFSVLWQRVGPFHDLSRVLGAGASEPAEAYGESWCTSAGGSAASDSLGASEFEAAYEQVMEAKVLARLAGLHERWDALLFDADRRLDELVALHEQCTRGLRELSLRQATYCLNFKSVNQKFNELSSRKVALAEKLAMLEELQGHYERYKSFARTIDQIENNEFIKTVGAAAAAPRADSSEDGASTTSERAQEDRDSVLARTLEYVDKIAEQLNSMLPAVDASIDFFSIHADYFDSGVYRYRYETLRTRVFGLIKMVFKELYNFVSEGSKGFSRFDLAEHYNKYRRVGRSVRNLNRYYTTQATELSNSEFLQLQMYYITSRIKILNPLMLLKMQSFEGFASITSFFLLVCNLEVLTFKETFVSDTTHESLGTMVENVVFYFAEACKKQVEKLQDSAQMRVALASLRGKLIAPILASSNGGVLQTLLLRAQQTYHTIELMLLRSTRREIALHVRGYEKQAFLAALCEETAFEVDWDHELLAAVRDSNLRGAGLYPPVCFAIGIVLANVDYLEAQNLNSIATEAVNAVKAALVDVQYAFGKKCRLDRPVARINQDLFLIRQLQYLLRHLDRFRLLDSYTAVKSLCNSAEQQFCAGVAGLLVGDFREFARKQRAHDEGVYRQRLETVMRELSDKLPRLKRQLAQQLVTEGLFDHIKTSLAEVVGQYATKFGIEPPVLPPDDGVADSDAPRGRLLML